MSTKKKWQQRIVLIVGAILLCLVMFYAGKLASAPASPEIEEVADEGPVKINLALTKIDDQKLSGKLSGEASLQLNGEIVEDGEFEAPTGSTLTVYNDLVEFTTPLGIAVFEAGSEAAAGVTPTGAKFVASKNGEKYHPVDSGSAKRIKDENKVFFTTQEEAQAAGYEAGKSVK